ncbi:hypothetical protein [Streptomyces sp. NBC_01235]|uniref:hypothetical protein n=1 Tax=Streptomyces sp. NBC_01235 TaxID=2903788 RepID=UPI002E1678CC|nr:hypothetical protein OG289_48690 [Streptomyces sp. NBC_01235]
MTPNGPHSVGNVALPAITETDLAGLPTGQLLAHSMTLVIRQIAMAPVSEMQEVVRGLDDVRSALFGYWVLHYHGSNALTGFGEEMPHRVVDADFFALLNQSLERLGDGDLLALVRDWQAELGRATALLEQEERARGKVAQGWDWERTARLLALLDKETMRALDARYRAGQPASLDRLSGYIREHAEAVFTVVK